MPIATLIGIAVIILGVAAIKYGVNLIRLAGKAVKDTIDK